MRLSDEQQSKKLQSVTVEEDKKSFKPDMHVKHEEEVKTEDDPLPKDEHHFENSADELHFNEEYRKRLIENNFDLMNGMTIQVTTKKEAIPKYFMPLDNLAEVKAAVA